MPRSVFSKSYATLLTHLKEVRRVKGFTQVQLGAKLGKPQSFVAKIENGERRLDVIEFIAVMRALGASPVVVFRDVTDAVEDTLAI